MSQFKKPNQKKVFVECQENWFAVLMKTEEVDKATKGLVPVITETSTRWAVKNFMDWTKIEIHFHLITPYHWIY